jgi:hypothetical protein
MHFNIRKRSEVHRNWNKEHDRPAGKVRRVLIKNVIARGQGSSQIAGHPESPLEEVTIENLRLAISHNPEALYDKAVNALEIKLADHFTLRNEEVNWEGPVYERWQNAVYVENVRDLEVDGLRARQAREGALNNAALVLNQVARAIISNCRATPGTGVFLKIPGSKTGDIFLGGNELSQALKPVEIGGGIRVRRLTKLDE